MHISQQNGNFDLSDKVYCTFNFAFREEQNVCRETIVEDFTHSFIVKNCNCTFLLVEFFLTIKCMFLTIMKAIFGSSAELSNA